MSEEPADTMRERSRRSTAWADVLFEADRKVVAGGLLVGVFFGLVGFAALFPNPAAAIRPRDAVETAFQLFIGTTITGVTLVRSETRLTRRRTTPCRSPVTGAPLS